MNSSDDIPKRGYMGTHKSKENGYTAMGARLYNSETGRFMSVDPLAELFTGHSPYSYSFNNPVMYSDPSGLAPEKENRTMAPGIGRMGGSITQGYWNETTQRVFMGEYNDSPLGPGTGTRKYEDMSVLYWVAGGGGGSSTSGPSLSNSGGGYSGSARSSRRGNNDHSLNRKSHEQKDAVRVNSRANDELANKRINDLLKGYQAEYNQEEIDRRNREDFENFVMNPLSDIGNFATIAELNKVRGNIIGFGEQYWKGQNGKWYSTGWGGNGSVGGKNNVLKSASYFRAIGYTAGVFSIVYSGYNAINEFNIGGNYETHLHDLSMTVVGFGGILGFTLSGAYFYSKYAPGVSYNSSKNSFIQDNTGTFQNYRD